MAIAVAITLALSGLFALIVVWTPRLGVRQHRRLSLVAAILGTVVAIATLVVLIAAPVIYGMAGSEWWPSIVTSYFLAMAHRLIDGPYPFFWTPQWMYVVGSLTPLIALGAFVALAAGYAALPSARRTAVVIVTVALCLLVAYALAGVYAAAGIWGGVPL